MTANFTICIQLTESCNICCKHCGTFSSPKAGMTFDPNDLLLLLEQIREVDPEANIAFSGGEVFSVRELLFYAIEQVRRLGLQYSITTNATWAIDPQERNLILDTISDCKKLGLSSDAYHAFLSIKSL